MQVYLDDRPLKPDPASFAAALRVGVDAAAESGRIVVEAQLDGEAVAESLLNSPPEEEIGRELRLISVEPRALVRVTLLDARDALEKAGEEQERCAALIQSGKIEEALPPLSSAVQTWGLVRDAVERSAALMRMPLDGMTVGGDGMEGRDVGELVTGLADRLEEIKRGLASQDWSALADVLAYDMGEQVERWKGLLVAMSDRCKE